MKKSMKRNFIVFVIALFLFSGINLTSGDTGGAQETENFFFDTGWMFRQQVGFPWYSRERTGDWQFVEEDQIKDFYAQGFFLCSDKNYFVVSTSGIGGLLDEDDGFGKYMKKSENGGLLDSKISCWAGGSYRSDRYAYQKQNSYIRGSGEFEIEIKSGSQIPTIEVVSCLISGEAKLKLCKDAGFGSCGMTNEDFRSIADFEIEGTKTAFGKDRLVIDNLNDGTDYYINGEAMCPLAVYGTQSKLDSDYAGCTNTAKISYESLVDDGVITRPYSLLSDIKASENGLRGYLRCLVRVVGAEKDPAVDQTQFDLDKHLIKFNCLNNEEDYPSNYCGYLNEKFAVEENGKRLWLDGIWYPSDGGPGTGGSSSGGTTGNDGVSYPDDPNNAQCDSCRPAGAANCHEACQQSGMKDAQGRSYVAGYCAGGEQCCICIPESIWENNCENCLSQVPYENCNQWCTSAGYNFGMCIKDDEHRDHDRCCGCWGLAEFCNDNGMCESYANGLKETYESCPFDCGADGGSSSKTPCKVNYDCTEWSDCDENNIQTRTCKISEADKVYIEACKADGRPIEGDNAVSRSCDGDSNCVDEDGDGENIKGDGCASGTDCDDTDADINSAASEVCGNDIDDDCDGSIDENCVDDCTNGEQQECGINEGECRKGIQTCVNGIWSVCGGSDYVGPVSESCNGLDDDCDGYIDDGVCEECVDGETKECGTDVGECSKGTTTCEDGEWGNVCEGEIGPEDEDCDDGKDNDCDGKIDDLDSECSGGSSIFRKKETCFDGIKNQDETGIDCGGVCKSCETECFGGLITSKCKCGLRSYETGYCCSGVYQTSPCSTEIDVSDSDGDGWADEYENQVGTNPLNKDTDFDEIIDSVDDNPLCNNDGKCDDSGTYPEKNCNDCSSNWWIWLLLILILILFALAVYYFVFMKKDKKKKPEKKVYVAGMLNKSKTHNFGSLVDYVQKARDAGLKDDSIVRKLTSSGWTSTEIRLAMQKSKMTKKPLNDYVKKALKAGKKVTEIEKNASKAGWSKKDISEAIKANKR